MKTHATPIKLLSVLLPLALSACGQSHSEVAPPITPVLVITVKSPAVNTLSSVSSSTAPTRQLPGFIASRYQTDVGFQVPGRIGERLVETGATVKQGQALLRLQSADYVQGLSAAEDQLQAARIDAQQSATDAKRFASLVQSGAVSEADQLAQQARADAAQARLQLAERQASIARNRLAYTTLTAPFDGVVTHLRAEVGQVVGEGHPVLQIARNDTPEVVVDVPEDLVTSIPTGPVSARLTGYANTHLTVRLREMDPSASLPLRTYRARFSLVSSDGATGHSGAKSFKLGMSAEVSIPVNSAPQRADNITLPANAIIAEGDTTSVWVVPGDTTALVKKPVTVMQLLDQGVRVSGLQAGDKVVIAGTEKLREGQSVRAIERTGTAYAPDANRSSLAKPTPAAAANAGAPR